MSSFNHIQNMSEDEDVPLPVPEFTGQVVTLGERYTFTDAEPSLIGLGSFGVVYRGSDENGTNVAIKKMLRLHIKEQELRVIQALRSPYLISVIDICPLGEEHTCLIMELCDSDLEQHLEAVQGKLEPSDLRVVVDNIARGYMALNELRIVHRDIKPQNILVKYDEHKRLVAAKITDFGIARVVLDEQEQLCNVAGTLYYMAPEVGANLVQRKQYDCKVDMWSIGCLIYQCLTGERPFDECSLCRLFLYTAGSNFDAYDPPELPDSTDGVMCDMLHSLLEIDCAKRATPAQFYAVGTQWGGIAAIVA